MGDMAMGGEAPLIDYPKFYWAAVGAAVGVATLANLFNYILYRQRLSAAKAGATHPARPNSWLLVATATTYALTREASNYSLRMSFKDRILRLPTLGRTALVAANVIVLVVLCFCGLDLQDRLNRENVGYRTGFVTIAQLPLVFLLAGKNNLIGYLTGISYERLNWLHRWCARCLLLTATIHMGYFLAAWAPYNYIGTQLRENTLVWKGLVAWALLVWIVFSSVTPVRGWCYEFFILQHLVSFAVFIGFVYVHTPAEVHIYVWFPVAIFFLDRVARTLRILYANISFFHPKQRKEGLMSGVWACRAEFTPLPHKTTRIVIQNPPISWTPGQHVFLSCHSIVPLQSHPFTIASIPKDGRMEFLVKAETGGTSRFFRHAEKIHRPPATFSRSCVKTVAIEGPYGCLRPLRQFDSIVLLAGSTGATFTVPLLRDIMQGWKENAKPERNKPSLFMPQMGAVTRNIRFVWVVKSRGQLGWFAGALSSVFSEFQTLHAQLKHIKLELTIYVTCDASFTGEQKTILSAMTAPNADGNSKKPQEAQQDVMKSRNQPPSLNEKEKFDDTREAITEVRTNSVSQVNNANSCGPNNTCCCKTTVDESSPDAIKASCCCCGPNNQDSTTQPISRTSTRSSTKPTPFIHPSISVFSGRPNPTDIIRRSLEQALGESAVVVCGPQALVADVKQDVCSLSDERAVHKGTGAQGIYLHTETFGY
ncbi:ferric-chelate reductase [Byssothecium circinans]|uniref:ferric-chelate reductase (NADPH) n=1 Tax=Byssothecium circinans TaxID=147558 RepID=A0A6A5UER7_9PLEO|nr:ferric-chelate reductase [Byssothecium circinans]